MTDVDLFATVFINRFRGQARRVYHVTEKCPDVRRSRNSRRARLGSVLAGQFTACRRCSLEALHFCGSRRKHGPHVWAVDLNCPGRPASSRVVAGVQVLETTRTADKEEVADRSCPCPPNDEALHRPSCRFSNLGEQA